jgi:large subunit ribosomal protein L9
MKVILLENVAKVGRKYEVVEVTPGYARNFLMPKNLGDSVTPASAGRVASLRREKEMIEKKHHEALEKALSGKGELVITFTAKANEEGHLFAGIDKEMIAEKVSGALGAEVTSGMVDLEKPIKEVGSKKVEISANGKKATILVNVSAE